MITLGEVMKAAGVGVPDKATTGRYVDELLRRVRDRRRAERNERFGATAKDGLKYSLAMARRLSKRPLK